MTSSQATTYAAFLGNQPSISLAELAATLPDLHVLRQSRDVLLFTTSAVLDQAALDRLGGTFLVAQAVQDVATAKDIPALLAAETANVKGKVTFSLRASKVDRETVRRLYRTCKKYLSDKGTPSRYIGNELKPPVSGLLHDSGVANGSQGCELVLVGIPDSDTVWVGRTVAVQDPRSYTERDMEKPVRDTRAGLLPPKLAQVLLNLGAWAQQQSGSDAEQTVLYDPFCGTGVIPIEALLRGWPVLASDLSLKAVRGSESNMEWLRKKQNIKKRDVPSSVWKQDATKPFAFDKASPATKMRPSVVVTETMLGPPLSQRPPVKDAQKYRAECDALEIDFLRNCASSLPGVPVVAMFPVWYMRSGPLMLERVWKELPRIGYSAVLPEGIPSDHQEHPSVIYRRPDQIVGRQIVILLPQPA